MPLPHYNPIHNAYHLYYQHTVTARTYASHIKPMWASGEAAFEETLEAVVADLHTGGVVLNGRFPEERSSTGNSAAELSD